MKKILVISGLMMAAIVALTGCQKEQNFIDRSFTVTASTDNGTKTTNGGMSTLWAEKDSLSVFYSVAGGNEFTNAGKFVLSSGEGTKKGQFTAVSAPQLAAGNYDWYAVYPYRVERESPAPSREGKGFTYIGHTKGINQPEYDDMSALCGSVCPMYGVAKNIPNTSVPGVTMKQLASVIEFNVKNNTDSPIKIKKIELDESGTQATIIGSFYVDITGESPVFTNSDPQFVKSIATVSVTNPADLAPKGVAKIYLPVKPYTHDSQQPFKVHVEGEQNGKATFNEFLLTPSAEKCTFEAGKIKKVTLDIAAVVVEPDPTFVFNTEEGIATLGIEKPAANQGTSVDGKTYTDQTSGNSISFVKGSAGTAPRVYLTQDGTALDLRIYKGSTFTITPPSGYYVTGVTLAGADVSKLACEVGTLVSGKWSGNETSITFSASGTVKINTITVIIESGAPVVSNTLSIDPASVTLAAAESSTSSFTVASNNDGWTIDSSSTAEWLTVTKDGATVKVVANANTGEARSTTFAVKHATDASLTVTATVNQEAYVAPSGNGDGTEANPYDATAAYNYASTLGKDDVSDVVYISGIISSVKYTFTAQHGTATFNISDDGTTSGSQFTCYSILYLENRSWQDGDAQIQVGDNVVICGKVINYNGNTPETKSKAAYIYKLNGQTSIQQSDSFGVEKTEISVGANETSATIKVTGNCAWTAESSDASVYPASGNGAGDIAVSFAANTSTDSPKTYSVVVSTTANVETKSFTVVITQAKAVGASATVISVDFKEQIEALPQAKANGQNDGTYILEGYEFIMHATDLFYQAASNNVYYLLIGKKDSYIQLPVVSGKALTGVKFLTGAGASTSVIVDITKTDGTPLNINTSTLNKGTEYEWSVGGEVGVAYRIQVMSNYNAQFQYITLTYE